MEHLFVPAAATETAEVEKVTLMEEIDGTQMNCLGV